MRRVFGPRTAVEAAFIVAVPVIAAALGARTWTIIAASAVAYLIIVVLEATLWREGASAPKRSRIRIPSRTVLVKRPEEATSPEPDAAAAAGVPVARSGRARCGARGGSRARRGGFGA